MGPTQPPKLSRADVLGTIAPVRLIICGALLGIFDYVPVALDGPHVRVDVLNDLLGAVLVAVGVFRLARLRVHPAWNDHYGASMKFVRMVAVLAVVDAALGFAAFERSRTWVVWLSALGILKVLAFCLLWICYRWVLLAGPFPASRRLWFIAISAFVVMLMVPGCYYYGFRMLGAMHGGLPEKVSPLSAAFFGLFVGAPLVLMFRATYTLGSEARAADFDAPRTE